MIRPTQPHEAESMASWSAQAHAELYALGATLADASDPRPPSERTPNVGAMRVAALALLAGAVGIVGLGAGFVMAVAGLVGWLG